jgi:enoyl-CoA hydratase
MANEIVLYEKKERVGLITINRPEVRNALNVGVFQSLDRILDDAAKDSDIRAVVVTGSGTTFVAGADINELLSMDSAEGWTASKFSHAVLDKLERLGKPSIAAMNGPALGGGLELALACTIRFASAEAKMGFPELGLGIVPGFGGTQRLIRTLGPTLAADMLLRRRIIGAEEAKSMGLVNEVVSRDETLSTALAAAGDLAALSPVAVGVTMELLQHSQSEGFDSGLAMESGLACLTLSTPEARKLLAKFLGKGKG